jgi:hypothetical protein
MGLAIASWAFGDLIRIVFYGEPLPAPAVPDIFHLGFYPLAGAGLIGLLRPRVGHLRRSVWLDGAIAALAVAALAAGLVLPLALSGLDEAGQIRLVLYTVYPMADVTLLGVVATALAVTGRQPSRDLVVVGTGLALFAVADVLFAWLGRGEVVLWIGATWILAMLLVAAASCLPPDVEAPGRVRAGVTMFLVPLVAAALCIGLLLTGSIVHLPLTGALLAAATLALGILRTAVTFRENVLLVETRRLAVTDELTGLANRRRLGERMDQAFARVADGTTAGLLLIDLNRFKELNDPLGHHVGDRMLEMLGPRLAAAVPAADVVARLGGDGPGDRVLGVR